MRLLILSSEFPPGPGGIGTHAFQLARHLSRLGWAVSAVTPQDYADAEEVEAFNARQPFTIVRLKPIPIAPLEAIFRWRVAARQIIRDNPAVILASGQRAVWLAAGLARRFGLPLAAVGHGSEFAAGRGWERAATRWAFRQARAVVSVSHYTRLHMLEAGIQPTASPVIHNGADDEQFVALAAPEVQAFREAHGLADGRLLLSVGNVTGRKGHDVVIRALPAILERFPDTRYLIAGLPTEAVGLSKLACRCGVERNVRFLGRVDGETLVRYLNACDVFVMTSRCTAGGDFEGYGIAVIEAALCGKPAVVTGSSGLAEAVDDGVTGRVVPQDDVAATTQAILSLLSDPTLRQRMGQAARSRAESGQTWAHRAAEYHTLLASLASRQRAGRAR